MDRTLEVWCSDEHAGTLTETPAGLLFRYADGWLASGRAPISQSLPVDGSYDPASVEAFFGGLLPEAEPRERLARILGVDRANTFSLLEALGGDTAGALSLYPPGPEPPLAGHDVEWQDDAEIEQVIAELPDRPLHADEEGEYRLSLAGVHDKLPVVVDDHGRIGLTRGRTPSTHILKTPIVALRDTVANEAMCPLIGRVLGIETVEALPRRVGEREFLLVTRYDREQTSAGTRRLHQEDFCQALAVPSGRKYQSEGGPSLADCFALLRRATSVPANQTIAFLDHVFLSFLVGNHDAHGKNFSLLYRPSQPTTVLAPAYDLLSTVAYSRWRTMSRKMAMSIGGEYRADYVRDRHLDRMLKEAGLGVAPARRRLRTLAEEAPGAAREARRRLTADGWGSDVLEEIVKVVERRSRMLAEIARPRPRTAPSPPRAAGEESLRDTMAALEERQAEGLAALGAISEAMSGIGELTARTAGRLFESVEEGRGMLGRLDVLTRYASELDAVADRVEPEISRFTLAFEPYVKGVTATIGILERDPKRQERGAGFAASVRSVAADIRQARAAVREMLDSIERNAARASPLRAPSRRLVALFERFLESTDAFEVLDGRVAALGFGSVDGSGHPAVNHLPSDAR